MLQLSPLFFLIRNDAADHDSHKSVVCGLTPRCPNLYGGVGGTPWDGGVFDGVKGVVCRNEDCIFSMSIEYDRNGKSVFSTMHGGSGGKIQNQSIWCVQGFYGAVNGSKVMKSLTFNTNKGKYGSLGEEASRFFSSDAEGDVVGFFGRSGCLLDALGIGYFDIGFQPKWGQKDIPIMPKALYDALDIRYGERDEKTCCRTHSRSNVFCVDVHTSLLLLCTALVSHSCMYCSF